jgi:hypothetical protein
MRLCPVSGCGIYHDPRMPCKMAAAQLRAGTMEEKYKVLNRLVEIQGKKAAAGTEKLPEGIGKAESRPAEPVPAVAPHFVCPVCEAKRKRKAEQMARYRARLRIANGG